MEWRIIRLSFYLAAFLGVASAAQQEYCHASDPNCDTEEHLHEKLRNKMIVAAIDFGTTYSGWAYQFKHKHKKDPTEMETSKWGSSNIMSRKTPTTVLIRPDGKTLEAFGYTAEDKYLSLAADDLHTEYYYFRRFKMMLYGKKDLNSHTEIEDDKGGKLPAITVFSLAIRFLKDDLFTKVTNSNPEFTLDDIHWVLTVPAIWNDTTKQFMRKSAVAAGISNEDLSIALEPEAASLYCRNLPLVKQKDDKGESFVNSFQPGRKYMVLDAGGGTVDITVHEVMRGNKLKELYRASGGPWGGTRVDDSFQQVLSTIIGDDMYSKFKKQCAYDHLDMFRSFESIKRNVSPESKDSIYFYFPQCLDSVLKKETGNEFRELLSSSVYKHDISLNWGKLKLTADFGRSLFKDVTESIVKSIRSLLSKSSVKGTNTVLMVGGFSDSRMLQEAIRREFKGVLNILIPPSAELSVVQGAVVFGFKPSAITERETRFTYGIDTVMVYIERLHDPSKRYQHPDTKKFYCKNLFSRHVKIGTKIKYGTVQGKERYTPISEKQTQIQFPVVACETEGPVYTTDEGCSVIGVGEIDVTDKSVPLRDRIFVAEFVFSDTEIKVAVTEERTKKKKEIYLNFVY